MAIIDILKQIELGNLSYEQKTELARLLRNHRRNLRKALAAVESGLQQVAPAPPATPPTPAASRRRRR